MELAVNDDLAQLALHGEYDLSRKHEIARLFDSIPEEKPVLIDLTEVTYLDSTILKELARLRERSQDRVISLVGANSNIRRIFNIVGFEQVFDIL